MHDRKQFLKHNNFNNVGNFIPFYFFEVINLTNESFNNRHIKRIYFRRKKNNEKK